jgi:hypothetical protein
MLKSKLALSKKKITILTATALCVVLIASSALYLFPGQIAQAAIINPHSGLVGWWSFNEGTGTIARDSSGNGNSGSKSGATWVTGKYDQALSFNGIDNYVSIPHNSILSGSKNFTVEAWFNPSTVAPSYQQIVGKQAYLNEYRLILVGNSIVGQVFSSSNGYAVSSSNGGVYAQVGIWQHASLTYDGANLKLYVNGILVNTLPLTITINPNTSPLFIGINSGELYSFNGIIDEVHVYKYALSATEIQQELEQGPNFSSNILAKVPTGTTQVITTLSWQGTASINATIVSPSQTYTESTQPIYQKTTYSTSDGTSTMLNIKRISISVGALTSDQNWNVTLAFDNPVPYQITVEAQK